MFDLLSGGISDRIPGETLFTRFHELFGPGIEDARFDPLPPTEVTNRDLPSETFQNDADESLGLLGRDLCYVGLIGVVLRHFRLLSRWGRSIPCTGSTDTPPPSCFSPFKSVPLSLNAYTQAQLHSPHESRTFCRCAPNSQGCRQTGWSVD